MQSIHCLGYRQNRTLLASPMSLVVLHVLALEGAALRLADGCEATTPSICSLHVMGQPQRVLIGPLLVQVLSARLVAVCC